MSNVPTDPDTRVEGWRRFEARAHEAKAESLEEFLVAIDDNEELLVQLHGYDDKRVHELRSLKSTVRDGIREFRARADHLDPVDHGLEEGE